MTSTTQLGEAALASWRGKVADAVATPASKRTKWSEDEVRAAVGAAFFALATFYVVSTAVRMIKAARG